VVTVVAVGVIRKGLMTSTVKTPTGKVTQIQKVQRKGMR
jgi:hypothetical protein